MKRRTFLGTAAAAGLVGCTSNSGPSATSTKAASSPWKGAVFIPGYKVERAVFRGQPVTRNRRLMRNVPRGYDGNLTLISRLDADGSLTQAVFPMTGHDLAVSSDGRRGYFAGINDNKYATFDPQTLTLRARAGSVGEGWIGGGHAAFIDGGSAIAVTERSPWQGYTGHPKDHFGAITIRDPRSLKILSQISTHGMSPHELRLLDDGQHVAIANYGTSYAPGATRRSTPAYLVEPSVTIVRLSDGALVKKLKTGSKRRELRHLAARDQDTIFAIQAEVTKQAPGTSFGHTRKALTEADPFANEGFGYLPAAPLRFDPRRERLVRLGGREAEMREGLSIEYDAQHDEVIASFSSSHRVGIFDGASGDLKHMIETDHLGLEHPAGVTILGDSGFYAVAGHWKNLFVFTRGSHELVREMCHYATFFGHSHIVSHASA